MLALLGICLFGTLAYCVYKSWGNIEFNTEQQERRNRIADTLQNIPIANHLEQYRMRKFDSDQLKRQTARNFGRSDSIDNRQSKSYIRILRGEAKADVIKECGVCFEPFQETDEVVECLLMHLFHAKCFEDNKDGARDDKCPTCQNSMKHIRASANPRRNTQLNEASTPLLDASKDVVSNESTVLRRTKTDLTGRSSLNDESDIVEENSLKGQN